MATYDGFISYSHAKDKPIAAVLQSTIQKLGKPWYRRRALRIFRDDTSLSATPSLWPSIEQALEASRYLILLVSPEAAASQWVNKEVTYWLDHKGVETLLIAATDGELDWDNAVGDFRSRTDTPLPPALKGRFTSEPKWVDLRAYRGAADKGDAKFTELAADFAAAIHGMPKEDLLSQEVRQQRRALTLAWSAAGSLFVLAGVAGWQWKVAVDAERLATEQKQIAQQQRDRAEKTLSAASQTANDLVYKLAAEFRSRKGMPIELVRSVLEQAQALQRRLAERGETTPLLRHAEGAAENELAIALQEIGDLAAALDAAEHARALVESAVQDQPEILSWQENLGVSYETIGNILRAMGRREAALSSYRRSLDAFERLAAGQPDQQKWEAHVASACTLIGGVLENSGKQREALTFLERSHAIWRRLAVDNSNIEWRRRLALSHRDIGSVLARLGKAAEALAAMRNSLSINEALALSKPDDAVLQLDLATAYRQLAGLLDVTGQRAAALDAYRKGLAINEVVATADPGNRRMQSTLAAAHRILAQALSGTDRREEALDHHRKAISIGERLIASDTGNAEWRSQLALSYSTFGATLWESGLGDAALEAHRKSLAINEALVARDGNNVDWQQNLSANYYSIGTVLLAAERYDEAVDLLIKKLAIDQHVSALLPDDLEAQNHLAAACGKLADTYQSMRRLEEARDYANRAIQTTRRMRAADPTNTQWQRNLIYDLFRIGNLESESQHYEEALKTFAEAVSIAETLAASDNNDLNWQNNLSLAYYFVDYAYAAMGKREEALAYARKAFAIREKISAADPGNMRRLRELANVYRHAAGLLMELGRNDEARGIYRKCFDARLTIALSDPRNSRYRTEIADAAAELALAGDDLQPLLAKIGDHAQRAVQESKFGEDGATWLKAMNEQVAFRYIERARDEFYAARPERAIGLTLTALQAESSYVYAMLFLHAYRVYVRADDTDELAANAQRANRSAWPWPILAYALGQLDIPALRAASASGHEQERAEQLCEADFFIGVFQSLRQPTDEARAALQSAANGCPHHFLEYAAAKLELERLAALAGSPPKQ